MIESPKQNSTPKEKKKKERKKMSSLFLYWAHVKII